MLLEVRLIGTAAWTVGDGEVLGLASVALSLSCTGASASSVLRKHAATSAREEAAAPGRSVLAAVDLHIEYAHDRLGHSGFSDANGSSDGVVPWSTVSDHAKESDQTQ